MASGARATWASNNCASVNSFGYSVRVSFSLASKERASSGELSVKFDRRCAASATPLPSSVSKYASRCSAVEPSN